MSIHINNYGHDKFRQELIDRVRDTGLDIADNAEAIVGDIPYLTECSITINIGVNGGFFDAFPSISVEHKFNSKHFRDRTIKRETSNE